MGKNTCWKQETYQQSGRQYRVITARWCLIRRMESAVIVSKLPATTRSFLSSDTTKTNAFLVALAKLTE